MPQYDKSIFQEQISGTILTITLYWKNNHIIKTELSWTTKKSSKSGIPSDIGKRLKALLLGYEQGEPITWPPLPLDWECIPKNSFSQNVLSLLSTVDYGAIITYGTLASLAGNPQASRTVGNIMSRNPWPLIIPCHRVIAANKQLTGFQGDGGLSMKAWLLRREGHTVYGENNTSKCINKTANKTYKQYID